MHPLFNLLNFIQRGSQDPPTDKIENYATIVNGF